MRAIILGGVMGNSTKTHLKAFLTNFEIACEAGVLALVSDLLWVVHDVLQNGLSLWYVTIFSGLSIGTILTAFALYRHHRYYTHRLIKKHINPKIKSIKTGECL